MEGTGNIESLVHNLFTGYTWVVLVITAVFGIVGGCAHKFTSSPEDKTTWWGSIVVGAVASIAVLFILTPLNPDAVRLIAQSLIAGYGGKAILDALETRLKTALAEAALSKETEKKAIEASKETAGIASVLSKRNSLLEKASRDKGQPPEALMETLKGQLPAALHGLAAESSDSLANKLACLSEKIDSMDKSCKK
jgi:hypothetical protein